jgi:hypothetical protein
MTIEIKVERINWVNKYCPSGTCSKNERKMFGRKTSETLEFKMFAKVRTMKDRLDSIQIKLAIAASFLNSKLVCATFPFTSRVKKVTARSVPTKKKLEVIEVNLKTVNKLLINVWLIFR